MGTNLNLANNSFEPRQAFLIGVDSDGCVFDSMEAKQKKCFSPNTVEHFGLEAVSEQAREASEFVGLYSKWRGSNRFPALVKTLDLLKERLALEGPEVAIPDLSALREWIARESRLGNPALEIEVERGGDPFIKHLLAWSLTVNKTIEECMGDGAPAFPKAPDTLRRAGKKADLLVVSQTPTEALVREWRKSGLSDLIRAIRGQEDGSKTEHLQEAMAGGAYAPGHVLMVGDALGDLRAAQEAGTFFFPIIPGRENTSWEDLFDEGLTRFFEQSFTDDYQRELNAAFEAVLPEKPGWGM